MIKNLVRDRMFGFIKTASGQEYFFHKSCLAPNVDFEMLDTGDSVAFRWENTNKGRRAVYVELP